MQSILKIRFTVPSSLASLLYSQLFGTISYAVLYSTVLLYLTEHLHFTPQKANLITGVYFAYSLSLHMLAGYIGGRFFSYRGFIAIGIIGQAIGCEILSHGTTQNLYWGLAGLLLGTGTIVTCLNMLMSQLYAQNEVQKRQTAFLWNYSSMNLGFILGCTIAGYYQLHSNYHTLFLWSTIFNIIGLAVLFFRWGDMRDRDTRYANSTNKISRNMLGICIIILLTPLLAWLLRHANFSDDFVLTLGALMFIMLLCMLFKTHGAERKKFIAFIILLFAAQVFWIVYQLAPMGLTLFAKNNVNRHVFGFLIPPAWLLNINTITIIIGAPLLGIFFRTIQRIKNTPLLPWQYSAGLMISGAGLLILPLGIIHAINGYTAFTWIFFTYVLEAIAELLISPIGYSMVGQLISVRWQSICMGATLLNSGVSAILASFFSNAALGKSGSTNPLITNASFAHLFGELGKYVLIAGLVFLIAARWLGKLMQE